MARTAELLGPNATEASNQILLDVSTRTPIKVFKVRQEGLQTACVRFNLQLTTKQTGIVALADRCICLLGRSGTGKTEAPSDIHASLLLRRHVGVGGCEADGRGRGEWCYLTSVRGS